MDDVEITDVDDGDMPYHVEKPDIKNQDLTSLSDQAGELLSQYGWHLLVVTVLVYLLIQHLMKRLSQSQRSPVPHAQQDASTVVRNQEAMEASRRRMQEELDAKAAIFKEKQKQQEEEKRRQKIEVWETMKQGKSYKGSTVSETPEAAGSSTTVLKPKTEKKSLRSSSYNPLAGDGGGTCSWRPGRRGPSAGG